MTRADLERISSYGGKISAMKGKGHRWTSETASRAGKKGAQKRWGSRRKHAAGE